MINLCDDYDTSLLIDVMDNLKIILFPLFLET